jgi:hypothetical protein
MIIKKKDIQARYKPIQIFWQPAIPITRHMPIFACHGLKTAIYLHR